MTILGGHRRFCWQVLLLPWICACGSDPRPLPQDASHGSPDRFVYCALSCAGCCTVAGTCQSGTTSPACGAKGTTCRSCPASETCTSQTCVPSAGPCGGATCTGGCCQGNTCRATASDAACGSAGGACVDCAAKNEVCVSGVCKPKCTFEVGCGDSTKYCDVGQCAACPAGKFNCDGKGQCECDGGCNGTSCKGPTSCDYYDQNVCGGDTTSWCWNNACTSCTSGFFNCNKTKGCECDAAGCNGTACAGSCSGGEC